MSCQKERYTIHLSSRITFPLYFSRTIVTNETHKVLLNPVCRFFFARRLRRLYQIRLKSDDLGAPQTPPGEPAAPWTPVGMITIQPDLILERNQRKWGLPAPRQGPPLVMGRFF